VSKGRALSEAGLFKPLRRSNGRQRTSNYPALSGRRSAPARESQSAGWKSSIGLPAGSSSRICFPLLPVTISLRKLAPAYAGLDLAGQILDLELDPVPSPTSGIRPSGIASPAPPLPAR
jgi:hypothetical protein